MFRCQTSEKITSTISMAWYFTTKSGGIWKFLLGFFGIFQAHQYTLKQPHGAFSL
jgi:hypothetical protein